MSDGGTLVVTLQGKDINLRSLVREVTREMRQAEAASGRAAKGLGDGLARGSERGARSLAQLTQAELRASREAISLAQAHARAEASSGRYAEAIARLNRAMEQQSAVSVKQGLQVNQQIAGYQKLAAAAAEAETLTGRVGGALNNLSTIAGAGFLLAATDGLVRFGSEAQDLALRTEAAKRSLEALAGSPRVYAEALAAAEQQQRLFGGTLAENIEGVQGLVTVARSSGAELTDLLDLSQRLSIKDPAQGVAGARIALQEALSGDPTSLARRYEIPKKALAALRDESTSGAEKLKIIDQYLNQIGITSEVVSGSIPQATVAFNSLNAELEQIKVNAGAGIAAGLAPVAGDLAAILGAINGLNTAANAATNGGLGQFIAQMQKALLATNPLAAAWFQLTDGITKLRGAMEGLGLIQDDQAAKQAAQEAAATANAATAQALARAYADGVINIQQYGAAMLQLRQATASGAEAQDTATSATEAGGAAAEKSAAQQAIQAAETKLAAEQLQQLQTAAQAAANGSGTIEQAAASLAAQFPITVDEAVKLITVLRELAALSGVPAAAAAAGRERLAGQRAQTRDLTNGGIGFNAPGRRGGGTPDDVVRQAEENQKASERAAAAQRDYEEAVGGSSAQLKNLRADLAGATVGSEEYWTTLKKIRDLEAKGSGGKGGGRASAAQKERDQLIQGTQDYMAEREELEASHQERLAEIAADGAKKREEAENEYRQNQLDSRASFYKSLADVDDQKTRENLAARYEQIRQEADTIAQTQGADAALAYSQAAEQALQGQAEIEQEIADAEKNKDKGRAEYLRGVLALQQAADAERLRQIQEQGSALAAETAAQYSAEEAAYAEHLAKMAAIYEEKFGQAAPGLAPPPPGGGVGTPAAAGVPATPTTPRAAAPAAETAPGAPGAPAQGTQLVTDPATQAAIDQLGARLGERLAEVSAGVDRVRAEVASVRSAVDGLGRRSALRP